MPEIELLEKEELVSYDEKIHLKNFWDNFFTWVDSNHPKTWNDVFFKERKEIMNKLLTTWLSTRWQIIAIKVLLSQAKTIISLIDSFIKGPWVIFDINDLHTKMNILLTQEEWKILANNTLRNKVSS